MATNFGRSLLATDSEKGVYTRMTTFNRTVESASSDVEILSWKSKKLVDVGGGPEKLECTSGYSEKTNKFSLNCGRMDNFECPISWRGSDKKIMDVRYGDIDKDGDIDIAVKLTDGAIYVFHNLSK